MSAERPVFVNFAGNTCYIVFGARRIGITAYIIKKGLGSLIKTIKFNILFYLAYLT